MKSILGVLLILIASTVAFANSITITDLSLVEAFQNGDVVSYNEAKKLERDRSWLAIKGDLSSRELDSPITKYFIRIIPAKNQFFVEIGCLVLKRELYFEPMGFVGNSFHGNASRRSPYYVSQTFLGGRKSQAFSYLQTNTKWLPKKDYFEFDDSPDSQRDFKKTLADLLRAFSSHFHLESDSQNALEKPPVNDDFRIYLTHRGEPEDASHRGGLALLKQLTSGIHEPKVDTNEVKAEGYFSALRDYRERIIKSDKNQAVMLVLESYPISF